MNTYSATPIRQKIFTVSAACGSGKTYAAITYAIKQATYGNKVVFVMPTKKLITQTLDNIGKDHPFEVRAIMSEDNVDRFAEEKGESVQAQIKEFVGTHLSTGCILLITEAAFLQLAGGYWSNSLDWILIKDELLQVSSTISHNLEEKYHFLKDMVGVEDDPTNSLYYRVVCKGRTECERAVYTMNDVSNVFRDLSIAVLNQHIDVYCLRTQWNNLSTQGNSQIEFYTTILPTIFDGFGEVTIMGANLDKSLLVQMWSDKVEFIKRDDFKTRFTGKHSLGNRKLTIYYIANGIWSKTKRNKLSEDDQNTIQNEWLNIVGSQPFIWNVNNDVSGKYFGDVTNAIKIAGVAHGDNSYDHVNNVFTGSALNTTPGHLKFILDKFRICADSVSESMSRESHYQQIFRSSARDINSKSDLIFCATDEVSALFIRDQFNQSSNITIKILPHNIGFLEQGQLPRKEAMSRAERDKKRNEKRDQELQEIRKIQMLLLAKGLKLQNLFELHVPTTTELLAQIRAKRDSMWTFDAKDLVKGVRVKASHQLIYLQIFDQNNRYKDESLYPRGTYQSTQDFEDLLALAQQQVIPNKESGLLFTSAYFSPKSTTRFRWGKDNVDFVSFLCLDDDCGNITREEIKNIFPNLRMTIANSYSSGKKCEVTGRTLIKTRYFIYYDQPISGELHEKIYEWVLKRIANKTGREIQRDLRDSDGKIVMFKDASGKSRPTPNPKDIGFDTSKKSRASIFYFPSQSGFGDEYSYFERKDGELFDTERFVAENYEEKVEMIERIPHTNPKSEKLQKMNASLSAKPDSIEEKKEREIQKIIAKIHANNVSGSRNATYRATVGMLMHTEKDYFYQSQLDRIREAGLQVSPDDWEQFTRTMRAKGITGRIQEFPTFAVAA